MLRCTGSKRISIVVQDTKLKYLVVKAVTGIRDGKNIEMPTFWEIQIPVPCIEEQTKIAEFFASMDDAIAAANEELDTYKLLKKGLLQQMFI